MKNYILVIIISFFNVFNLSSQSKYFVGFEDSTQTSMTIDFKFVNNLVVIPIQINNSDTLWFILDSGIRPTLLTSFSDTIEFDVADTNTIRGLGEGEDLKVWHTFDNVLKINGIKMTMQNVFVLEKDKFELSEKMGIQINGIIGNSIFESFIVEIDYNKHKITFHSMQNFEYKKKHKKWIKIPLKIYKGKPYTKIKVLLENELTFFADVLIDLGASDALWLFPNSSDSIKVDTTRKSYYLGQGLNGDIYGYQSKIPKIIFDDKHFLKNVTVSYPDPRGLNVPDDYDIPGRNGSIGSELLRRFDVIFDYHNKQMLLKKNSFYKDKFNFELSGVEIIAPFVGLHYYEIYYIQKNSPGAKAGLKAGDEIIKINNLNATQYSLNDILVILREREGKKVKFLVKRDGVEIETKVILENYRL